MILKKEEEISNLNVAIKSKTIRKAKAKSALLGINIADYIARLIEVNTQNISLEIDDKPKKRKNDNNI